jgi:aminomethyltransferase
MTQPHANALKLSPLNARQRALGARMVPFAGWDLPAEYAGFAAEHLAVRTAAGLFDLSHMGQIEVAGPRALEAMQWLCCNDASRLQPGESQASALLTPAGTFVDDVRVFRFGGSHFLLVVNAANTEKDLAWVQEQAGPFGVAVVDTSSRYAVLALQGPAAFAVVQPLCNLDVTSLDEQAFVHGEVAAVRATIARTGSTAEDGVEVFVPPAQAPLLWDAILKAGRDAGVVPAGLSARDTLRLEAGIRLFGSDFDDSSTALEAGLADRLGWNKDDFLGREALAAQKTGGPGRRLVGFEMLEPGAVARHGCPVVIHGQPAGRVTSGADTPYLKQAIGFAYLPADHAEAGAAFDVDIRGRLSPARVVPVPFYRRSRG